MSFSYPWRWQMVKRFGSHHRKITWKTINSFGQTSKKVLLKKATMFDSKLLPDHWLWQLFLCCFLCIWSDSVCVFLFKILLPPKLTCNLKMDPVEKEIPFGKHHFQVPCWFGGVYLFCWIGAKQKLFQKCFMTDPMDWLSFFTPLKINVMKCWFRCFPFSKRWFF